MNPRPLMCEGQLNDSLAVENTKCYGEGDEVEQLPERRSHAGEAPYQEPGNDGHSEHHVGNVLICRTSNDQISYNLKKKSFCSFNYCHSSHLYAHIYHLYTPSISFFEI